MAHWLSILSKRASTACALAIATVLLVTANPTMAASKAENTDVAEEVAEEKVPKYSTYTTPIGVMLDTPELREIFAKHLPKVAASDRINRARNRTLRNIQKFRRNVFTDEILDAIDRDLAALNHTDAS